MFKRYIYIKKKKVLSAQRQEKQLLRDKKSTPPLSIKGYALYKIDGKSTLQRQNSYVASRCHRCLLRITFITIQRYATYFFIVWFL